MKKYLTLFLLLPSLAWAQQDQTAAKVNQLVAQQIGMLEIAKVGLQVELEAARAEIERLKKELEGKSGNKP